MSRMMETTRKPCSRQERLGISAIASEARNISSAAMATRTTPPVPIRPVSGV